MHPEHPMRDGDPPSWASGYGVDRFGPYAEFRVDDVVQRMRWVPPGTFLMGSPADEPGRDGDEAQHEVRITRGYWMADTPVTQALWAAVMGENPSRFVHPRRPVERVSWGDAQRFIERLDARLPGLAPRLPTEAEWECACRAGTTTATYAGDLEIVGANNAPILDDIAWYGGNSGVDFDLEAGEDSSGWPAKQHPHVKAGTRIVAGKAANPLGIYDMLGNVWEWCLDWLGDYAGDATDPGGPERGANRVARGGSWLSDAGDVRAASRGGSSPGNRLGTLGFRLSRGPAPGARSAEGAEPRAGAERPVPRSGAPGVSGGAAVPEADPGRRPAEHFASADDFRARSEAARRPPTPAERRLLAGVLGFAPDAIWSRPTAGGGQLFVTVHEGEFEVVWVNPQREAKRLRGPREHSLREGTRAFLPLASLDGAGDFCAFAYDGASGTGLWGTTIELFHLQSDELVSVLTEELDYFDANGPGENPDSSEMALTVLGPTAEHPAEVRTTHRLRFGEVEATFERRHRWDGATFVDATSAEERSREAEANRRISEAIEAARRLPDET